MSPLLFTSQCSLGIFVGESNHSVLRHILIVGVLLRTNLFDLCDQSTSVKMFNFTTATYGLSKLLFSLSYQL